MGTLDSLIEGARVVVSGTYRDRTLIADRIYLKSQKSNHFKGRVGAVNSAAGTLSLFETTYFINSLTSYIDRSSRSNRYINLKDIDAGDEVEVFAIWSEGRWVITRIERLNFDEKNEQVIAGKIKYNEDDQTFYLLDTNIDISELDEEDLELLREGVNVTIKGTYQGRQSFKVKKIIESEEDKCDDLVFFKCFDFDPPPRVKRNRYPRH